VTAAADRLQALRDGNLTTITPEDLEGVLDGLGVSVASRAAAGGALAAFQQEVTQELVQLAQAGMQAGSNFENNRPFTFRGAKYGWARFRGRPVPVKWGSVAGMGAPASAASGQPVGARMESDAPGPEPARSGAAASTDLGRISDAEHPLAVAIGHAEGNRTVDGARTSSYYGHSDPGNGASNQGTFSAQQGYASPEAADAAWVRKLNRQLPGWSERIAPYAAPGTVGHQRLLANAADLYVQAPAAVPDFLKQASDVAALGFSPEAVATARADSFIDPRSGRLQAAGFNNDYRRLLADQRRRGAALRRVLER
jgi:hypothetical protein